ncbi:diacylglycerol/lipid kinase family protein [Ornithinimicrobium cryptoxanthini]|uniref:diacylglycerol/lipid kinase family protein n=1 Tax=Ornithinimicrobium cryptoxanthini TaxID=2934161 RepID=UPI002117A608|nr:diacylglycerol kinase family protein [Ornithinimicrobium cryptoxanthini]
MASARPVLVLVNDSSGSAEQERVEEVCRALARHSASATEVRAPASDQEYAAVVASAEGRDVVVVGGDGSVHRLLQELTDQQLLDRVGAVGLVPMGTGNDLARDAGVPLDWREAVDVAVSGRPARRSLLVDQGGDVVVNVVHCGVAAEATAHAAEVKGLLGRTAYLWGAVRTGLTMKGWHLRVVVDGRTVVDGSDKVLMVSAALGSSVGGGTLIAPQARDDDGLVDVLVACGTSPWTRVGFARDLRHARHVERDDVITARGRQVLVEASSTRDNFRVNADGDVSDDRSSGRRWELLEGVWRLRVPR